MAKRYRTTMPAQATRLARRIAFIAGASLCLAASVATADVIYDASLLLNQGKAKEAYRLLLTEEGNQAGKVDYDYLLGRAALDAGEAAKATLIFERVLAVDPNHAGARLDMGRAYFALGDFPRAKSEFESLLALNPPAAAKHTIEQYLAAIENRINPPRNRVSAYAELGFGRDSNVTVGPRSNSIYFPVFGMNFNVGQSARAQGDNYRQAGAGAELVHTLDARNALFIGADLRHKNYAKLDAYDQLTGELRGGWIHTRDQDTFRAYTSFADLHLGDEPYRETVSIGGDWRRRLDPRNEISVFTQGSRLRYVQRGQDGNNYDQYIFGAAWTGLPATAGGLVVSASAYYGREKEYLPRTDGNKNFLGLRGGAQVGLLPSVDLFGSAGVQLGQYDRRNIIFQDKRQDRQLDLTLGASWKFSPGWSLRPQVVWLRNNSNTKTNEYERTEGNITLRKDF